MDSVSQFVLGAAVGEAVLGRKFGNRAILWGGAIGTLPDLDVVMSPWLDTVEMFVYHRGLSHSLLAVAVLSPLLALLFRRMYRNYPEPIGFGRWHWYFFLILLTHILLDCCTTYGTQIFLPFSDYRVAFNNVFIIDPVYTMPLLLAVLISLWIKKTSRVRASINGVALALSTGYLLVALAVKITVVDPHFLANARQQGIEVERFMTCPTPMNSVLWYGVVEDTLGYHVGYYSLFDRGPIEFDCVPRNDAELIQLVDSYAVDRLIWFADGYYCVERHERGAVFHVMKFGDLSLGEGERMFPFSFLITRGDHGDMSVTRFNSNRNVDLKQKAAKLWQRICGNSTEDPK